MNDNFKNDSEKSKYLFCDGSTFSSSTYPKLYQILGGNRLPDLRNRYLQGNAVGNTVIEAGLPNITGVIDNSNSDNETLTEADSFKQSGAIWYDKGNSSYGYYDGGNSGYNRLNFDASRSNPIYGNSTTVTPPTVTVRYYIRAK